MTHLKRLGVPRNWPIPRKGLKFAVNPRSGPHSKRDCIPLRIILRDMIQVTDSAREAKTVLSEGKVLVDRKPRKDSHFPVGLMDVIEIPEAREFHRMTSTKSGMTLEKISQDEAAWKYCKIVGKTTLKRGLQQLNLHDGRNLVVKKDTYKVGDTIKISLPDQKVLKHIRLEKGSQGLITAGRNIGSWGKIKDIEEKDHMLEKSTVTLDTGKREFKTLKEFIFAAERPGKE